MSQLSVGVKTLEFSCRNTLKIVSQQIMFTQAIHNNHLREMLSFRQIFIGFHVRRSLSSVEVSVFGKAYLC